MADPVKISDLPAISSVQPNDIVPVVDAALTQTSRATAAQIAAIGGGRPGDGMVLTQSLANGAVTAEKTGFTGPDKLISRTLNGSGAGVEIPCTSYARGLLAAGSASAARQYLDALQGTESPTFSGTVTVNGAMNVSGAIAANGGITGQIKSGDGTANAPSYSFSNDTDTGIARLGGDGTVSIITNGVERIRIDGNGTLSSRIDGTGDLYAAHPCRAWGKINAYSYSGWWGKGMSSVQVLGAGTTRFNFSPAMPDRNYAVVLGLMGHPNGFWLKDASIDYVTAPTENYVQVRTGRGDQEYNLQGVDWVTIAVFR